MSAPVREGRSDAKVARLPILRNASRGALGQDHGKGSWVGWKVKECTESRDGMATGRHVKRLR